MGWEQELFAFLDELEGQAEMLYDAERHDELADRSRAEYRQVTFASRLMASLGREVTLEVSGVGPVCGVLDRVAAHWCLLSGGAAPDWIVPVPAVTRLWGASDRSVPEAAWSPLTRLSLGSALRRLSSSGERCLVHLLDGARLEGAVGRVGRDFTELVSPGGRAVLVPFAAIGAVQSVRAGQESS